MLSDIYCVDILLKYFIKKKFFIKNSFVLLGENLNLNLRYKGILIMYCK